MRILNCSFLFCATLILAACSHSTKISEPQLRRQLHRAESAVAQSELLCDLILHHRLPVVMARESAIALQEQVENEQKQLTGKTPDASQREVVSQLRSVHEQLFRDLGALANQGEDPAAVKQLWRKIQACQTLLPGTPP